ncbi:hypothetical protein QBC45DRAFT_414824 [Copromyces sp. CBS 386.78]|nr:hypothetical protein QBC45DRAFT_414824 [Copromyces sp. CBS 386.78]
MFFNQALVAVSGFAVLSQAHMLMNTPKPFSSPGLQNGPLKDTGADFPCQASPGTVFSGTPSPMALGSKQNLAFTGSAVHGGGSCQISITYDTQPNKNSVWKVIHSIEGGCPAKNTEGNLPENPDLATPFGYQFPIPGDIPTGNATIAWTWLNKIGNREFYMNCAPVTLTGNGGDKSNWESLPNMLVANIPSINNCRTKEGRDYKFPNPGKSVDVFASDFSDGLIDCGGSSSGGGSDGGSGNGGSGSAPAPITTAPAAAPTNAYGGGGGGGGGGIFITAPVPDSPAVTPTASAPAPPAQTGGGSSGGGSGSGSGSGSGAGSGSGSGGSGSSGAGSACSAEGMWNCIDGKSYQQCAAGVWTPVMPLAAGTSCDVGQSTSLNIKAAGKKMRRLVRFRG